jgi:large subunit ribosomal protein L6
MPIPVPTSVQVRLDDGQLTVRGPLGELKQQLPPRVSLEIEEAQVLVRRPDDSRPSKALHGLTRSLVANMVQGVSQGFEKRLDIAGVGYRAQQSGTGITLQVGFSHPVSFNAPDGVKLVVEAPNRILVSGPDKQMVGETAARIRRVRPPEPYKGKGIRYLGEVVRRKAGKAGAKKK